MFVLFLLLLGFDFLMYSELHVEHMLKIKTMLRDANIRVVCCNDQKWINWALGIFIFIVFILDKHLVVLR